jgi:hypothetical protein
MLEKGVESTFQSAENVLSLDLKVLRRIYLGKYSLSCTMNMCLPSINYISMKNRDHFDEIASYEAGTGNTKNNPVTPYSAKKEENVQ